MKTKQTLLLPLLFFAALLLVPALTLYGLVKSPSGWSVEENRALADVPEVSLQSMLDGTLVQNLETFYSDHIFARRQLLKLDTLLQMKCMMWCWAIPFYCPRRAFPRNSPGKRARRRQFRLRKGFKA